MGEETYFNPPISALSPVNLNYGTTAGSISSHLQSYTFTDYDIKYSTIGLLPNQGGLKQANLEGHEHLQEGQYQYSIEFEMYDPTIDFLLTKYDKIRKALNSLKTYVEMANGSQSTLGKGVMNYYNSYTGKFSSTFTKGVGKEHYDKHNNKWEEAWWAAYEMLALTSGAKIAPGKTDPALLAATVGTFTEASTWLPTDGQTKEGSLLDPLYATPEGINVAYDILKHTFDQLEKYIGSVSSKKIPKVTSATIKNADGTESPVVQNFTKQPLGSELPRRKIKIKYDFNSPEEIVVTSKSTAGYNYFGQTANRSTNSIGLKVISKVDYDGRSETEHQKYFNTNAAATAQVPLSVYLEETGNLYDVDVTAHHAKGRFFTVPLYYTFLPNYFVDSGTENKYWELVNNIIRYKRNLPGDSKAFTDTLGYGENDKVPGTLAIKPEMEKIIKNYQTLASMGAFFDHSTLVDPQQDSALAYLKKQGANEGKSNNDNSGDENPGFDNSGGPKKDPQGEGNNIEDPNDNGNSLNKLAMQKIPWAKNYGQGKVLLSLICANAFNLNVLDLQLGTFNTRQKSSRISRVINRLASSFIVLNGLDMTIFNFVQPYLNSLPPQILALMYNHYNSDLLNPNFDYNTTGGEGNPGPVYDEGLTDLSNDDTMYVDKFGEFWFNHQNLGEVEYLAGYDKTIEPPPVEVEIVDAPAFLGKNSMMIGSSAPTPNKEATTIKKYENTHNGYVNCPRWEHLTKSKLANFKLQDAAIGGHILCRIKKYKNPVFNPLPYDILSLPIYDEYFFIASAEININQNAYTFGPPNPNVVMNDPKESVQPVQIEKDENYCSENPDDPDCEQQAQTPDVTCPPGWFYDSATGKCVPPGGQPSF